MFFKKKCHHCKAEIPKGQEIKTEVEVYGLVGTHKKSFCSEDCLDEYEEVTAQKLSTRKEGVCVSCVASQRR